MPQENASARDAENSSSSSEHSLITNSPIGIITTTLEGVLLSANPAMARMFGYDSPDELFESVNGNTTHEQVLQNDEFQIRKILMQNGRWLACNDTESVQPGPDTAPEDDVRIIGRCVWYGKDIA